MNAQLLANQVKTLFTLPEVAFRLNTLLGSPDSLNSEFEEVIMSDPAFTAKILKIVNSSYFGFPKSITSISRALTLIGRRELMNLALTASVTTCFKGIPKDLVDMDIFWYHSVTTGVLARELARELAHPEYERLFIEGLLHSIGKLIYFITLPDLSKDILTYKDHGEDAIIAAEREKLGFTHAELGAEFLKHWNLPPIIWQAINDHLDPLYAESGDDDACILHVASKVGSSIEPCAKHDFTTASPEPKFKPGVLDHLKLSNEQINHCADNAIVMAFAILATINPEATIIF